jgi:hypothetical protein
MTAGDIQAKKNIRSKKEKIIKERGTQIPRFRAVCLKPEINKFCVIVPFMVTASSTPVSTFF